MLNFSLFIYLFIFCFDRLIRRSTVKNSNVELKNLSDVQGGEESVENRIAIQAQSELVILSLFSLFFFFYFNFFCLG